MKSKHDIRLPSMSDVEDFLKEPLDISIEKGTKPKIKPSYSQEYVAFLNTKIWENSDYTIDNLVSGDDIVDTFHHSVTPKTVLRAEVNKCLDSNSLLSIQMIEDCGHRLDSLEKEVEENIKENSLTSSVYMRVKRSSDAIRDIFFVITSKIEHDDEQALQEKTKFNIKKIMQMNSKVDEHLDEMLSSINKEELKADRSTWITIGLVVIFAFIYMTSFFALDSEKSATDQILYFFGVR